MATLLSLAMALIIAAQSPNVPAQLRVQALNVASIAIQYVQTHPEPVMGAVDTAAIERAERDARAAENDRLLMIQESKVRAAKEMKLTELKNKIVEYDMQLTEIDAQIAQANAIREKLGTGATAYDI